MLVPASTSEVSDADKLDFALRRLAKLQIRLRSTRRSLKRPMSDLEQGAAMHELQIRRLEREVQDLSAGAEDLRVANVDVALVTLAIVAFAALVIAIARICADTGLLCNFLFFSLRT